MKGAIIGIDIGGTFTDCVVMGQEGEVQIGKALSTPPDFHHGFIDSIRVCADAAGVDLSTLLQGAQRVLHGCTVGTNSLVERRTAKVGLLTTRGHRDSIFSMQSGRRLRSLSAESIANVAMHVKPDPIVPRHLVRELDERVTADGSVLVALSEDQVRLMVSELLEEGVDALAVSLLWSIAEDRHERRIVEIIREMAPEIYVSSASQVVPRAGEYERTVATVVNCLIGPEMDRYLSQLEDRCHALGYLGAVQVMTCTGGLISSEEARSLPVLTVGSGPVAGLIGAHKPRQSLTGA